MNATNTARPAQLSATMEAARWLARQNNQANRAKLIELRRLAAAGARANVAR